MSMTLFEQPGKANTQETLRLAVAAAKEKGFDLVVASSRGDSAYVALDEAKKQGYEGNIVIVPTAWGAKNRGENRMSREIIADLRSKGCEVVFAAHALSGAERGLSTVFKGVYPVEVMAHTLRMFGQGVKVCVEIGLMAMDAGVVDQNRPMVAVGGTAVGADTACILTAGYTASILDTKIHEIICKPSLYKPVDDSIEKPVFGVK